MLYRARNSDEDIENKPGQCDPWLPVTVGPPQAWPPSMLTTTFISPPSTFVVSFSMKDVTRRPPTLMTCGAPAFLLFGGAYTVRREPQVKPSSCETTESMVNRPLCVFSNTQLYPHTRSTVNRCKKKKEPPGWNTYIKFPFPSISVTPVMPSREVIP